MATTLTVRAARARLDAVRRLRPLDEASACEARRELAAAVAAVAERVR